MGSGIARGKQLDVVAAATRCSDRRVMNLRKDEALDRLADEGNVAQFVAFRPAGDGRAIQTFSRIRSAVPNQVFQANEEAIAALLEASDDRLLNLRSFTPDAPRSREFIYGVETVEEALAHLDRLIGAGLNVIVNETIDVHDGGVSGVVQGDLMEFAPDDTPRCVEKPGTVSVSRRLGSALLDIVYGAGSDLEGLPAGRVEFSLHPRPRGWRHSHLLLWEHEAETGQSAQPVLAWPNRFSRHLGDKAFGLIMAHLHDLPVPQTLVISRRVAPFHFGLTTGSREVWTRTAPLEQQPGKFTTVRGWIDPFALLAREDPGQEAIASILTQSAVDAVYSGAAIGTRDGDLLIEGVAGPGDALMLGGALPQELPDWVRSDVEALHRNAVDKLGPVRFEWGHDGRQAWCLQLHQGLTDSSGSVLVSGEAEAWISFAPDQGLETLRNLLEHLPNNAGVLIEGRIGVTSHLADLLRKSGRPARIRS